jgi:hypothetical protein
VLVMSYVENRLERAIRRRMRNHGRDEVTDVLAIALAEVRALERYRQEASMLTEDPHQPVAQDAETAALSLQDRVRELEADAVQIRRDHATATMRLTQEVRELRSDYVAWCARIAQFELGRSQPQGHNPPERKDV